MTEQKSMLFSMLTTEQQQVSVLWLHIKNDQFLHRFRVSRNREELTSRVRPDVECQILHDTTPARPNRTSFIEFHSRPDLLESTLQQFHTFFLSNGHLSEWAARAAGKPALQLGRSQGTLITVGGSNPGLSYEARREVAVNFTTD
jgi:hypothetical protein